MDLPEAYGRIRWVMNGVPIAVVSRYLGHSSINQAMVYSHLQPDNAARAIAAMMSYYPNRKLTPKTDTSGFRRSRQIVKLFFFNKREWRNWQTHQT